MNKHKIPNLNKPNYNYIFMEGENILFESTIYEDIYFKQIEYLEGDRSKLSYNNKEKSEDLTIRSFGHPTIKLHIIKIRE